MSVKNSVAVPVENPDGNPNWLSVAEFAWEIDRKQDTVRRLIKKKKIRALILPGNGGYGPVRIPRSELDRFLKENSNF